MAREANDLWQALLQGGEVLATEEDYEHGYAREVRGDLEQYVAFRVSGEVYGLSIAQIGEIAKPLPTTPVPRTASFVIGVANARGTVIPVLDLASRLHLRPLTPSRASRVLIVRHGGEYYGLLVDAVIGVVPIAPEDLEETPGAIGGTRGDFIQALARREGSLVIVLDLTVLLDARDFVARSKGGRRPA